MTISTVCMSDEYYRRNEEFYRTTPKNVVPLREPDYIIVREPKYVVPEYVIPESKFMIREYRFGFFRRPKRITEYKFYLNGVNDR